MLQDGTYLVGAVINSADPNISEQQFQSQWSPTGASLTLELRRIPIECEMEGSKESSVFKHKYIPTRTTSSSFLDDLETNMSSSKNTAVYFYHEKGIFMMSWIFYKVEEISLGIPMFITMNLQTQATPFSALIPSQQTSDPIDHEQLVLNIMDLSRYRALGTYVNKEVSVPVQFSCPLRLNSHSRVAADSSYVSISLTNDHPTRLLYIHTLDLDLKETRKNENMAFVDASNMFLLKCMNPLPQGSPLTISTEESYTFVFRIVAKISCTPSSTIPSNMNIEFFEGMNISTLHITYSIGNERDSRSGTGSKMRRSKEKVLSKAITWQGVISDQRFSILENSNDIGKAKKNVTIITKFTIKNLSPINRKVKLISLNHDNESTPDMVFFENESEQVVIPAGGTATLSVHVLPLREGVANKNSVLLEEEELVDVDTITGEKEKKRTIFQINNHFVPIEIGASNDEL